MPPLSASINYSIIQRCLDPENQQAITQESERISQLIQAVYGTSAESRMRAYWALDRLSTISKFKQVEIDFARYGINTIELIQSELLTLTNYQGEPFKYRIAFKNLGMLESYIAAYGFLINASTYRVVTRKIYCLGLKELETILPYADLKDAPQVASHLASGFNTAKLATAVAHLENQARHYLQGNLEPLLLILNSSSSSS